jgi:hypothetical protein
MYAVGSGDPGRKRPITPASLATQAPAVKKTEKIKAHHPNPYVSRVP